MSTYKLIYFNAKGRAEVARFIFAQAGVEYEDKRVDREEWANLKPSTPTGMLPMLEVDGKQLPGSGTLSRFLAERLGLAGSNDFENAQIASIVDVPDDFVQCMAAIFYEKDETRKATLKEKIEKEDIPKYFGILEKQFKTNSSEDGWVYGNKPTWADFSIYNVLEFLPMLFPNSDSILDSYPGTKKMKSAVEGLPKIAKWLQERPKTEH